MNHNLLYIVLVPLIGSLLSYGIGRINKNFSGWIATTASFCSFLLVYKAFSGLTSEVKYLEENLFNWFSVNTFKIDFLLRFDALTAVMCLVITGIGTLIHFYSIAYMAHDESRPRFFAYLNLFMFSMLLLVLGGNLLVLFSGWEGVGLCSYLLIGFWYKNTEYAAAGRKAFVMNRIGDAGFLIGIFLIFLHFQTFDFLVLAEQIKASANATNTITLIAMMLFVGAAGKSAQIPLFTWLPDAMAGPTPVSALIHAATMVSAGLYLMARMNFLFDLAPCTLSIICVIALMTALVAATIALTQNDIKKVLAYSTVSQLGFMFMAAACGAYWVAIFHVVTHAFFKACLFLGAGSVIHGCHHEQDMRKMGGLLRKMPVTAITFLIAVIAIAGLAPFSGYYSKHAILSAIGEANNPYLVEIAAYILITAKMVSFLTAFYMTRCFAMTFLGTYRGHAHVHESPYQMTLPLVVLGVFSAIAAFYPLAHLADFLSSVMPITPHQHESLFSAILNSWTAVLGIAAGMFMYAGKSALPEKAKSTFGTFYKVFEGKYFLDEIYSKLVINPFAKISRVLWKVFDAGIIDSSVDGTAGLLDTNGQILSRIQTGQVRHYSFYMFFATIVLITLYVLI